MSFGILPLCWTLGLGLPTPAQGEAAGLEPADATHRVVCCSSFLTQTRAIS